MGGYAIFTFDKLKNSSEMGSRYKHNFRIYEDIANVDYTRTDNNIEYISLNGKDYEQASKEEILRMKMYGSDQRIRKDAVLGYEIYMGYSHDSVKIPVEQWAQKSIDWLQKTFNPENNEIHISDKEGNDKTIQSDNVKSVVLHMDESTPHIHAYVVPIDEQGHLNARRYTGDRSALIRLQTAYAQEMKEFGLKRGMEKSNATASDIARYHSYLKQTVSATLPEPMIGESVNDYWKRANEVLQCEKAQHRQDVLNLEQKIREVSSERTAQIEELSKTYSDTGRQIISLAKETGVREIDDDMIHAIGQGYHENETFKKAVDNYPDQEESTRIMDDYMRMIRWQQERDRDDKDYKSLENR